MKIRVDRTSFADWNEPLIRPFGFKGGAMTEIAQSAVTIQAGGQSAVGLCTQNVLWCDGELFAESGECSSNEFMRRTTRYALSLLNGVEFESPAELLDEIFDDVYTEAKKITRKSDLRPTFALNALVGIDNALWTLVYRLNRFLTFDDLVPSDCRAALSFRHAQVAAVPLISYHVPAAEIRRTAELGCFFMKIKIGQSGTEEEMLAKDMARLTEIHAAVGHLTTDKTADGHIPYYFDANGRYGKKETLLRLLHHAEKMGALSRIALVEEPFDERAEIDVNDLPVRLAADESAHSVSDVARRIEMGYRAVALKPAAKTLSVSMKMAAAAFERGVACFVADLTVIPQLVEWNKNVAARLAPFPGVGCGLLESNGHQNYRRWEELIGRLPDPSAEWVRPVGGVYRTGPKFFAASGNIFS